MSREITDISLHHYRLHTRVVDLLELGFKM